MDNSPSTGFIKLILWLGISFSIISCSSIGLRDVFESGKASWYGGQFNGRKTASGERFNMYQMTAAHRKLPFGTRVLVRCPSTGKSVSVRINDRGPYAGDRIIDLSYAAARELGMVQMGEARVELSVDKRMPAAAGVSKFNNSQRLVSRK